MSIDQRIRTFVTLEDSGNDRQPVLRFARQYEAPVERMWRAVIDDAEFSSWFGIQRRIERPAVDGGVQLSFPGGEPDPGVVLGIRPPELLEITWLTEVLRFEVSADGDGSVLVFSTTVADRGHISHSAAGYALSMEGLALMLAGEAGTLVGVPTLPDFTELAEHFAKTLLPN